MLNEQSDSHLRRYWAVAGKNLDQCKQSNWSWVNVAPFIIATGDDPDVVLDVAWFLAEDVSSIHLHDHKDYLP